MRRNFVIALGIGLCCTGTANAQAAQPVVDAKWIWLDEGNPLQDAKPGKVWFRREVRGDEPSTGAVRIAGDDQFTLWVNGKRIGEGGGDKSFRFNLNGIVDRGINVIAIEATNADGRAGLLVDGVVRGQSGREIPFDSGDQWRATKTAPMGTAWLEPRFDDSAWKPVKVLGSHDQSPWKAIEFGGSYLDRYDVPAGFELKRVAEPDLVGSLVAFTWGNRGRLIASRERGPILNVIDENGDGVYDKVTEFTNQVTNCQGLCMVADDLYVVGTGPDGKAGLYRLPDRNRDDKADKVEQLTEYRGGMGEHGPHSVTLGPDGWLYNNLGNHAWVTVEPQPTSPVRNPYEGDLLTPRFEDANGHAAGIKVPGGTIWRLTPDGKKWWLETNGFRNEYDFAINGRGDIFSFDSDMEWDVGQPWYRPVRVNHCIPGAEFGWRSGAAKWPSFYFDSLPGTVDVGRGSPTGVTFYEHRQFPEKYQGSFLVCDWSVGRIIAVPLSANGATYKGTGENLVTGNPLNVSDIDVDRDGSVVFTTGGRNTEGGIYRVSYIGESGSAKSAGVAAVDTLEDVLNMPQFQTAWARESASKVKEKLGELWAPGILDAVKSGSPSQKIRGLTLLSQFGPQPTSDLLISLTSDPDATVRAFATWLLGNHSELAVAETLGKLLKDENAMVRRRACEAFVRSGLEAPVEPLLELLASDDRWMRFAARLTLERVPVAKWREQVLESKVPTVALNGLLALHRLGPEILSPDKALQLELSLLKAEQSFQAEQRVDVRRMIELTLQAGGKGPVADEIGATLLNGFPVGDAPTDMESSRLMAVLQVPGAAGKIMDAMEKAKGQALQIHYALSLRYLKAGWDAGLKDRLVRWYEGTQGWEGGHSFAPYLANIVGATLEYFTPAERKAFVQTWKQHPYAARLIVQRSEPSQIGDHEAVMDRLLADQTQQPATAQREELINLAIDSLGKNPSPQAQALLRKLFDEQPDRRGEIAQNLAQHPVPENRPYLLQSLLFAEKPTLQVCIRALRRLKLKPEKPTDYRSVILAGLQLGDQGGLAAADLLQVWTGDKHGSGKDANAALAHYQKWFHEKYPNEPSAELPKVSEGAKYSYDQLVKLASTNGDAANGKVIFTKANCVKCHRFLNEGEGIGPDLTTVRRRFQAKEIVESLVYPSKVISDQYRGVTVATSEGLVYTGLLVPQADPNKVVLLLSDAKKVDVAKGDIEVQRPAKVSVMPEDLLKDLSPKEIADLFAFLETSKFNAEPAKGASADASGAAKSN